MKALIWLILCASATTADSPPPEPKITKLAPEVWAVFEMRAARREPDGNSVVFAAPSGLIVMDSGRHSWHYEALLHLAQHEHRPIVAVINSHWHLDHASGNPALRERYPHLVVYASNAIDGALRGFLADSLKSSPQYLADSSLPSEIREDIAADRLTILDGAALRPDVVVSSSRPMTIGGKRLQVNLARHAATAGDDWVVDAKSGVAALGDLVTLPAPYFETACPKGWSNALEEVSKRQFNTAIPGHGPGMSTSDLRRYRTAFDAYLRCAAGDETAEQCAVAWVDGVQPLLLSGGYDPAEANQTATYYVGLLRKSNFQQRYCELD